jgi:hypothetical protein
MDKNSKGFPNAYYFEESQKWKSFSTKLQFASTKIEKDFPLIFVDFDVKYWI